MFARIMLSCNKDQQILYSFNIFSFTFTFCYADVFTPKFYATFLFYAAKSKICYDKRAFGMGMKDASKAEKGEKSCFICSIYEN